MSDHGRKEKGVKPWKRTFEACDEGPAQGEHKITSVMHFAGFAVCAVSAHSSNRLYYVQTLTPTVYKERVSSVSRYRLGVFHSLPGQLRESLSL